MKIAFISDIHSNKNGLALVLDKLKGFDKIFCAGDITGYYPFPNETISLLKNSKAFCIKGNHDEYLLKGFAPESTNSIVKLSVRIAKRLINSECIDFLKSLPDSLKVIISDKRVLVCHGSPWNHLEERIYPDYPYFERFTRVDADIIVFGHTHYPFIHKIGKKIIINSGSCGQPRDYNLLSYATWNTESGKFAIKRLKWDIEKFKKEAIEYGTDSNLLEVFSRVK